MPTKPDPNSQLTGMAYFSYDRKTKVHKYRDDKDGSVWQTHPKKRYGELKPYGDRPLDSTEIIWGPDKGPDRPPPRTNLYVVHPQLEVYVPNGTRKNGVELGAIWKHDYDEGWDVFVYHWPSHLVRRPRARGECKQEAESGPAKERKDRRATVEVGDENEATR